MDILSETKVSIREVAIEMPGRDPGKPLNVSTIWRWIFKGIRTSDSSIIRLEAVRVGSRWITSKEAVARFTARLTEANLPTPLPRTPEKRKRTVDRVSRRLEGEGI